MLKHDYSIGDRVMTYHKRHGWLKGTVILINDTHLTARLDKPRKKDYPTDHEDEYTDFKRFWERLDD